MFCQAPINMGIDLVLFLLLIRAFYYFFFVGRKMFARHLKNCNLSLQKLAKCDLCKRIFVNKMQMQIHYMREHNKIDNRCGSFECQICGQVIMSRTYITRHMRVIHNQSRRIFCTICNKPFKNYSQFDRHNQTVHFLLTTKKLYKCHRCSKKFQKRTLLKSHLSSHWSLDSKRYQCKKCGKCFGSRSFFVTHTVRKLCAAVDIMISLKCKGLIKDLTCPICKKSYNRDFNLRSHLLLHDNSYRKCRFCGVSYTLTSSLKRHMVKKHPGEKVFYCDRCEMAFDTYNHLKSHYNSDIHEAKLKIKAEREGLSEVHNSVFTSSVSVKQEVVNECHYIKQEKFDEEETST